jgi:Tol biopolymer transport system component
MPPSSAFGTFSRQREKGVVKQADKHGSTLPGVIVLDDPKTGNLNASTRVEGEDRLDSWKRIATYLKRDVSTVQRWERRESMPVHRHQHDKLGSVFAFRSELDAWWKSRHAELADDVGAASSEQAQRAPGESGTPARHLPTRSQKLWVLATAALVLVIAAIGWYAVESDFFWRSPLAEAKFIPVLDFSGEQEAAAISRDGKQFAFIAESEGRIDAWLSAANSGRYRNLTNGRVGELINPATRTLGFSADSQLVFVWTRKAEGFRPADVNIMAAPTAAPTTDGGSLQPYLAGAAELDSSHDGKRIVYHTTAPGDPLFIRDLSAPPGAADRRIYVAPDGVHCHFPVWSQDDAYIYFVRGVPPDEWDVWRVRATGADLERITTHNSRVAYPVLLDRRTLLYLAYDAERTGPWMYAIDVERRVPHRISLGVETFTSLAASADGLHLVATVANPRTSIWRMKLETGAAPTLLSPNGSNPRFAEHGVMYVAESANGQGLWKSAEGTRSEIWHAARGRIVGAPAVSLDRGRVALAVEEGGRSKLYVTDADGSHVRLLADSLVLRGNPSWAPDGQSIAVAAQHDGKPNLTRVFLDGAAPIAFTSEYSIDPAWSPDGQFLVYTGSDVGTTFPLRAAAADGHPYPLPGIMLTRGARRVTFLPNSQALAILSGGIGHKNLALLDLQTGAQRALAELPADFNIRDFDISADGSELVFERVEGNSHIALIERKP